MNKIHRTISAALVTLGLVGTAVFVAAQPAQASWSDCPSQRVCLWDADGGAGYPLWGISQATAIPGSCIAVAGSANDRANSYLNRRTDGKHVSFYEHWNCTGILLQNPPQPVPAGSGGTFPYISNSGTNNKNKASAVFIHTG